MTTTGFGFRVPSGNKSLFHYFFIILDLIRWSVFVFLFVSFGIEFCWVRGGRGCGHSVVWRTCGASGQVGCWSGHDHERRRRKFGRMSRADSAWKALKTSFAKRKHWWASEWASVNLSECVSLRVESCGVEHERNMFWIARIWWRIRPARPELKAVDGARAWPGDRVLLGVALATGS